MDYSKHNNEKKRKKIRSNAAKSRKKVSFNIFRFTVLAILLIIVVGAAAAIGGFKGVIDSAPDISASDVMPSKLKSVMYYPAPAVHCTIHRLFTARITHQQIVDNSCGNSVENSFYPEFMLLWRV